MPSLLIEAGPGCGKTSTVSDITTYLRATNREVWWKNHKYLTDEQRAIIAWCDEHLPHDGTIIGMAFNKEASLSLERRVHRSVECRSVHGWGYKVLQAHYNRYIPVKDGALTTLIEKVTGRPLQSMNDKYAWLCAGRYFEKLKEELMDPTQTNLQFLSQKYDDLASYKFDNTTIERILQIIPEAKKIDFKRGIQFVDQLWMACFILAKDPEPRYDIAIIDECQDISAARRYICNSLAKHKLWIGDRYQAVNAFAGADANSVDKIISLNPPPEILPLKTSFRCPPNIIKKLNTLRPLAKLKGLDKPDGLEERITLEQYATIVQDVCPSTTLTLCRTNAPLIRAAYSLLTANISCRILGDRVVDQLASIVKRLTKPTMPLFLQALDKYEGNITRNLDDYIAELFRDKMSCIRFVADRVSSPEEIAGELRKLFKPSSDDHATLCTIHKGKGAEAENIFILFPPIQSVLARTPEQKEQEMNLEYVARSRTKSNTYWVVE